MNQPITPSEILLEEYLIPQQKLTAHVQPAMIIARTS